MRRLNFTGKEMSVALLFCAGLAGENRGKRRVVFHQATQRRKNLVEVIEVMHALSAAAEFAGSLRAAQKEFAEDGGLETREVESLLKAVLVFGDAAIHVICTAGKVLFGESAQGVFDRGIVEVHVRIAIRFLVAGVDERVQGERVVVGSGDFLLDEGPEDAGFDGSEN